MRTLFCLLIILVWTQGCSIEATSTNETLLPAIDLFNGNNSIKSIRASGNTNKGFKDGLWTYQIESKTETVFWSKTEKESLQLSLPTNWTDKTKNSPKFSFRTISKSKDYVLTLVQKDVEYISIEAYANAIQQDSKTNPKDSVAQQKDYLIQFEKGEIYYVLIENSISKTNSQQAIVKCDGGKFYQVKLESNGAIEIKDRILFSGILFSIRLEDKFLIQKDNLIVGFEKY